MTLARRGTPILLVLGFVTSLHAQEMPNQSVTAPTPAPDGWTVTHMLSPGDIVHPDDVQIHKLDYAVSGAFSLDRSPIGLEVKHRILSNRPLMDRDVQRPSLVKTNMPVRILWHSGPISMEMEGRSLQNGSAGDSIRVLNTSSSRTIQGVVMSDGSVQVGG